MLTLQLSVPVTQLLLLLLPSAPRLEQVWTWTAAGTAPDAMSYHGARKNAVIRSPPQTADEENVTHCPQSVTLIGSCAAIESAVLQIAVVTGEKSVLQPLSSKAIRALGSASVAVGKAALTLACIGR